MRGMGCGPFRQRGFACKEGVVQWLAAGLQQRTWVRVVRAMTRHKEMCLGGRACTVDMTDVLWKQKEEAHLNVKVGMVGEEDIS